MALRGLEAIRKTAVWPDLGYNLGRHGRRPVTPTEFPGWNVTRQCVFNSAVIPRAGLTGVDRDDVF